MLQFSVLTKIRFRWGLNQADELAKLRDQVGRLTNVLSIVTQERDRLMEDASKVSEEHWLHLVRVVSEVQAASEAMEKVIAAAAEEKVLGTFVLGFEARLSELKKDHVTECRTVKRVGF